MSIDNEPLIDRHVHTYLSDILGPSDYLDLLRGAVAQLIDAAAYLHRPFGEVELGALAHSIKGSLGSMGLMRLAQVAAQIEGRCKQGKYDVQDGPLFLCIITDTRRALENLLEPPTFLHP
jgi:HPt (histidine-containing phosphotransfer) domain-containing protein